MFNFKKLKLTKSHLSESKSSFVGIRRNLNNELEFSLPKGFEDFPDGDFYKTKNLFFSMYKVFGKFEKDHFEKRFLDERPSGKDNIDVNSGAYLFKDSEDNDVILYSKISMIEGLLDIYNDLSIDTIDKSFGKTDQIDYKYLDKYLDKAVFLENDAIHIDEMTLSRYCIQYKNNLLIDLFCFILKELKYELGEPIDSRVSELANLFALEHLGPCQSLFDEHSFEVTISILKDILHKIDIMTPYKDNMYWRLFEAVEKFLYSELNMDHISNDGTFWGINNFFQIWEDMCNTYSFENFNVLFADTNIVFKGERVSNFNLGLHKVFKRKDFYYPFSIEFRAAIRWMRPDLVHILNEKENINSVFDQYISVKRNSLGRALGRVSFEIKVNHGEYGKYFDQLDSKFEKAARRENGVRRSVNNNTISYSEYPSKGFDSLCKQFKLEFNQSKKITRIIDWKYLGMDYFKFSSGKMEFDIIKQLCYEHCIQSTPNTSIDNLESAFVIPTYLDKKSDKRSAILEKVSLSESNSTKKLLNSRISIYKIDFMSVKEAYLRNDTIK